MGGRKSYSAQKVLGDLRHTAKERKEISNAMESEQPKKVVQATLDAFRKSDKAISHLNRLFDLVDLFNQTEGETYDKKEARKKATDYWTKTKKEKNIRTETEIDRLLIDSAAAALKKRGVKK